MSGAYFLQAIFFWNQENGLNGWFVASAAFMLTAWILIWIFRTELPTRWHSPIMIAAIGAIVIGAANSAVAQAMLRAPMGANIGGLAVISMLLSIAGLAAPLVLLLAGRSAGAQTAWAVAFIAMLAFSVPFWIAAQNHPVGSPQLATAFLRTLESPKWIAILMGIAFLVGPPSWLLKGAPLPPEKSATVTIEPWPEPVPPCGVVASGPATSTHYYQLFGLDPSDPPHHIQAITELHIQNAKAKGDLLQAQRLVEASAVLNDPDLKSNYDLSLLADG